MVLLVSEIQGLPTYTGAVPSTAFTVRAVNGRLYKTGTSVALAGDSSTSVGAGATGTATNTSRFNKITTPALTTAADATYTLTVTNPMVTATDIIVISPQRGTATTGTLVPISVTAAAGSYVAVLQNVSTVAVNGTMIINAVVEKVI